jgi:pimeloyl-ACP methyl ester carboxylesterase
VLLFLHGFPSSSYDWRFLIELEPERAVLAADFLGFGLSEKPRDHDYTLVWQADMIEKVIRRELPGRPCFAVAHDMGTSVATELMAREIEGRLGSTFAGRCSSTAAWSRRRRARPWPNGSCAGGWDPSPPG